MIRWPPQIHVPGGFLLALGGAACGPFPHTQMSQATSLTEADGDELMGKYQDQSG